MVITYLGGTAPGQYSNVLSQRYLSQGYALQYNCACTFNVGRGNRKGHSDIEPQLI